MQKYLVGAGVMLALVLSVMLITRVHILGAVPGSASTFYDLNLDTANGIGTGSILLNGVSVMTSSTSGAVINVSTLNATSSIVDAGTLSATAGTFTLGVAVSGATSTMATSNFVLNSTSTGLVLRTATSGVGGGVCYRLTLNSDGTLATSSASCF